MLIFNVLFELFLLDLEPSGAHMHLLGRDLGSGGGGSWAGGQGNKWPVFVMCGLTEKDKLIQGLNKPFGSEMGG